MWSPVVYEALQGAEPVAPAISFYKLGNTWRHYEKVRPPEAQRDHRGHQRRSKFCVFQTGRGVKEWGAAEKMQRWDRAVDVDPSNGPKKLDWFNIIYERR